MVFYIGVQMRTGEELGRVGCHLEGCVALAQQHSLPTSPSGSTLRTLSYPQDSIWKKILRDVHSQGLKRTDVGRDL